MVPPLSHCSEQVVNSTGNYKKSSQKLNVINPQGKALSSYLTENATIAPLPYANEL